ncbi:MAG: SIR2 family protein [Sediminibacterium sp.]|nr:SIR2 family protein [Sediminibacterium sp.]
MRKTYLTPINKDSTSHFQKSAQEWTFCLGAGLNKGILPDWSDLTLSMINKVFMFGWTKTEFDDHNKKIGFSYDSWIQACLNKQIQNGYNIESFHSLLENELYGELLSKADSQGVKELVQRFLNKPMMKKNENKKIIRFFEMNYSGTTILQVVDALISDPKKYKHPGSIITFNADPLLYSLLTVYYQEKYATKTHPKTTGPFKAILKSFNTWGDKIPIFHLHGSIFPTMVSSPSIKAKSNDGRENLIFLESSYTKVAGSMFTWAQTNFLYHALNTKMLFFGMSMVDSNIRKWLNWTSEHINSDLTSFHSDDTIYNRHIWLKVKPSDTQLQEFYQSSLQHLGVKMGWIDNYSQVQMALLNLMTI